MVLSIIKKYTCRIYTKATMRVETDTWCGLCAFLRKAWLEISENMILLLFPIQIHPFRITNNNFDYSSTISQFSQLDEIMWIIVLSVYCTRNFDWKILLQHTIPYRTSPPQPGNPLKRHTTTCWKFKCKTC